MQSGSLEAEHIRSISSWDSGGGMSVDLVELADGRVLAVTDESVVLYESMGDLEAGEAKNRPVIYLVE